MFKINQESFKRYFTNTSWLFAEKIVRMPVLLIVGIYVARYLGPQNYGLLNYAISFVAVFASIASLGLDNFVVRELVENQIEEKNVLGTSIVLKLFGFLIAFILILIFMTLLPNDKTSKYLIAVISLGLLFQAYTVIELFFQAKVLAKYMAYVNLSQLVVISLVNFILIYKKAGIIYFAFVNISESFLLLVFYLITYYKKGVPVLLWRFNFSMAKDLLYNCWPYICSGLIVSVYMRIDRIIMNNLLNSHAVGIYSAACRLTEIWYFIPVLVSKSIFPAITNAKNEDEAKYQNRLQLFYSIMTWSGIAIIFPIFIFSKEIIRFLFGAAYMEAYKILSVQIWAILFVFLSTARSNWVVLENQQRNDMISKGISVIINIILNYILLPAYGVIGASITLIITLILNTFIIPAFMNKIQREQVIYFLKSFNPFILYTLLKISINDKK